MLKISLFVIQEMNAEFEDRAIKAELDSGFGVRRWSYFL
jgi:hypothetical protein